MPAPQPRHATGVIHGRFQVLHNDHMRYLLAGKDRCGHLVIGVTNPDPVLTRAEESDPNRSSPLANPLTYYERQALLRAALAGAGLADRDYTVTPFPINFPELYRCYAPPEAVYFLTIADDWGRRKLEYFRSLGLATEVLWEVAPEDKGITGSQVRRLIVENGPWEDLVPAPVAEMVRAWGLRQRLLDMAAGG